MSHGKKRTLLLGLGFGILFATLVIQLGLKQKTPPSAVASKEVVDQWVEEHEFVLVKQDEWKEIKQDQGAATVPKTIRYSSVYIVPGMTSQEVERLFKQADLIPEDNFFREEIKNKNLENKIKAGTFTFKENTSLDKIIKEITD